MCERPIYFDDRHVSSSVKDLTYITAKDGVVIDFHAGAKSGTIKVENTPAVRDALLRLLTEAEANPDKDLLSICAREHNGTDALILHLGER